LGSVPVTRESLPETALLSTYAASGAYTDCYATTVPGDVELARFVEAFYVGRVFKLERLLLRWFAGRPSSDAEARAVARGETTRFAAWDVEARTNDQLLMCDMAGRTRSWFMVAPAGDGRGGTRLRFGSAVVPVRDRATGEQRMGWPFAALLGFHRLYSRVLLAAAGDRLRRALPSQTP
jgi:hypothetical protein